MLTSIVMGLLLAGHVITLLHQHLEFSRIDLGDDKFAIIVRVQHVIGKGASQGQQGLRYMSRVYAQSVSARWLGGWCGCLSCCVTGTC
jgi:hypothetical protein